MNQVWNIFWKDVRHYWREAAVCIALVAAYGWKVVLDWRVGEDVAIGVGGLLSPELLAGLVARLLPIAWAFLLVRVIQGESLVGDRQFWVTRPYEWPKLLAAKTLFILIFVNLPLLILDVYLLAKAGFPPSSYIGGLLWMQVLMSIYFFLPLVVLACVTATIVQVFLAALMLVLYTVGMTFVEHLIPNSDFVSNTGGSLVFGMFIVICLAVILVQYARRKTSKARGLIAGLAGVLTLMVVVTPYRTLIAREFPQPSAGQKVPFYVRLQPVPEPPTDSSDDRAQKEVEFSLPITVSGLDTNSILHLNGYIVDIASPGAAHSNSGWRPARYQVFPEQKTMPVSFTLRRDFFEHIQSSPVTLRVLLAFTLFRDMQAKEFMTPSGAFTMEDVGRCVSDYRFLRQIHCLSPLRRPTSLLITAEMAKSTCLPFEGEVPAAEGDIGRYWLRDESGLADFGISPVDVVDLYVQPSNWTPNRRIAAGICPGTPLVLSHPEPVRRNQTTLEVEGVRLSDYRVVRPQIGFGRATIRAH